MKKTISTLAPVVESRLEFPHFPTKMQTFIFRNWDIVPANRIAACLGCSVSEVEKQAYKMGLKPQKDVSCWLTRGYISIIKANWALLPYEQLLTILGWDEEKLGMVLKDEDFLKFKLGDIKPLCDKIEYRELTAEEEVITEKIRKTIEDIGGTMPEDLPTPNKSLKEIENKKLLKYSSYFIIAPVLLATYI